LGAQYAQGDVLLFLDAHCKPEAGAIAKLVADVDESHGQAIVTPTVCTLDPMTWVNDAKSPGHGYLVELDTLKWRWIPRSQMRPAGRFFESPSLIGCCFAVTKQLYQKLWGFDQDMYMWGVEDVDFGVKSWLLGHPVLHDPEAVIGHRFQKAFTTYKVPNDYLMANRMRMAYKVLAPRHWQQWLDQFRLGQQPDLWHKAWDTFTIRRATAEVERVYLTQHARHDAVWYARQFGLTWPTG
jgi:GT2 family glycosyltransferase